MTKLGEKLLHRGSKAASPKKWERYCHIYQNQIS